MQYSNIHAIISNTEITLFATGGGHYGTPLAAINDNAGIMTISVLGKRTVLKMQKQIDLDVHIKNENLKSPASPLFTQPFIQAQTKENTKVPRHWPLCGEFTGDRTNGQ